MKIDLTEEQLEGHDRAIRRGAIEGTIASGLAALGGSAYLQRHWATYRNLPVSLKVLGGIIIVAPCLSIQAERRGLEYDESQWTGDGAMILNEKEQKTQKRWEGMSASEKLGDWASRHEYSIIMGSWALSLALAGGIISRDRYQTTSQKVVQARMWAQGLTIGILIAAGALKHSQRDTGRQRYEDHSWKDVLEQQERQRQEDEAHLRATQEQAAAARRIALTH